MKEKKKKIHLNLYLYDEQVYLLKKRALDEGITVSELVYKAYQSYSRDNPKDGNAVRFPE